jgi:hypothetical protein
MFIKIDFLCRTNVLLNFIIRYIKLNQIILFLLLHFLRFMSLFLLCLFLLFSIMYIYFHLKLTLYVLYSQNLYLFFLVFFSSVFFRYSFRTSKLTKSTLVYFLRVPKKDNLFLFCVVPMCIYVLFYK